jgi:hypothetical protein
MLNEYCAVVYGLTNGYMAAWNEQGGIGPAGLSTEDLHVLDLTQAKPRWHRWVICICPFPSFALLLFFMVIRPQHTISSCFRGGSF